MRDTSATNRKTTPVQLGSSVRALTDFIWNTMVLPFYPIFELKDMYGFNTEDKFEIRFRVLAGDDDSARVLIDNVSIIDIP